MAGGNPANHPSPDRSPPRQIPMGALHRASMMPPNVHDPVLRRLVSQRPTLELMSYVAQQTVAAIPWVGQESTLKTCATLAVPFSDEATLDLPTPPLTPVKESSDKSSPTSLPTRRIPSLEHFILHLVTIANVKVGTLLAIVVYLNRMKKVIPPMSEGLACTHHRVFLATLIVASKYFNDCSPKNKFWARAAILFEMHEVNLMERQLLYLLSYQLRFDEADACSHIPSLLCNPRPLSVTPSLARSEAVEKVTKAGMKRAEEARIQLPLTPSYESPRIPAVASTHMSASASFASRLTGFAPCPAAPIIPLKKPVYTNVHLTVPRFPSPHSSYTPNSRSSSTASSSSSSSGLFSSTSADAVMDPNSSASSFSSTDTVTSHRPHHRQHTVCESYSTRPFVLLPVPPHAFRNQPKEPKDEKETQLDETVPPSHLRTAFSSAGPSRRPATPAFGIAPGVHVSPPTPALVRSPTLHSATPPTSGGPVTPSLMSARFPNLAYSRPPTPGTGMVRAISEMCVAREEREDEGGLNWRNTKHGSELFLDASSSAPKTSFSSSSPAPAAPTGPKFLARMWPRSFRSPMGDMKVKVRGREKMAVAASMGSIAATVNPSRGRKERSPSVGRPWLKVLSSPLPSFQRGKGRVGSREIGIPVSRSYA